MVKKLIYYRYLYLMMLPGLVALFIFNYLPMAGLVIAFQDFSPFKGITGSEWVGLEHFKNLFASPEFLSILTNTVVISFYKLFFGFPAPIILALLLNEVRKKMFKRFLQTVTYLPYFISWVIIAGMAYTLFNPYYGLVGEWVKAVTGGYTDPITNPETFRTFLVASHIWKSMGWGSIIYLAALSNIDPSLYEASEIDGAGRWKKLLHVTMPAIRNVIAIVFILSVGSLLSGDFEQIYLLMGATPTPDMLEVSDVFETFVYRLGILNFQFSFPAAVGLFQSFFAMWLVISANWLARKLNYESIW